MGVHLLAYETAVASSSYTKLSAVSDVYPTDNNNFLLPTDRKLLCAMAGGGIISNAKISMPSLNQVAIPNIEPVVVAAQPGNNAPVCEFLPMPLT